MGKENLVKRLENIDLPEIEIQSHKQKLRAVLLNSNQFKGGIATIFPIGKLVPIFAVLVFAIIFGINFINPRLMTAKATEIARNNPQIQKVMEERGTTIKEVKVKDGRAYVLLTLPEENLTALMGETKQNKIVAQNEDGEMEIFSGSVAEIDLENEEVDDVKDLKINNATTTLLTEEERARAIEIAKNDTKIKEIMISTNATSVIKNVVPMPAFKLRLEDDHDEIKVSKRNNEDKRVVVNFTISNKQYAVIVNLTKNKVEGVISLGKENESDNGEKTNDNSENNRGVEGAESDSDKRNSKIESEENNGEINNVSASTTNDEIKTGEREEEIDED